MRGNGKENVFLQFVTRYTGNSPRLPKALGQRMPALSSSAIDQVPQRSVLLCPLTHSLRRPNLYMMAVTKILITPVSTTVSPNIEAQGEQPIPIKLVIYNLGDHCFHFIATCLFHHASQTFTAHQPHNSQLLSNIKISKTWMIFK